MEDNGRCEHEMCNCPVTDDGSYCSQNCEEAASQDLSEIACGCGHASCG